MATYRKLSVFSIFLWTLGWGFSLVGEQGASELVERKTGRLTSNL